MSTYEILFISTWFGLGCISMIATWISDMRGKEFDKNYFEISGILFSLIVFMLGYLSFTVVVFIYCHNHTPFTKLIYKIINIGVDKKSKKED